MLKSLFAPLAMKVAGGLVALSMAACLFLYISLLGEQRHSAKLETRLVKTQAEYDQFALKVKAKADEFAAKATQLARETESRQNEISQEVSRDYQTRLADLRARYNRLRTEAGANPRSPGKDDLPGASPSPIGPDAGSPPDLYACEANTLQLEMLQKWIRDQGMAP